MDAAVRSPYLPNSAVVTTINSDACGRICFIAIGSPCSDSACITNCGKVVKGEEIGYFVHGGTPYVLMVRGSLSSRTDVCVPHCRSFVLLADLVGIRARRVHRG
jgi:hypothetical protein